MEKQSKNLSKWIVYFRLIALVLNIVSIVYIGILLFIPNIIEQTLKIWLVTVCGCSCIGIIVALFATRKDSIKTLGFSLISAFLSGIFYGIASTALAING